MSGPEFQGGDTDPLALFKAYETEHPEQDLSALQSFLADGLELVASLDLLNKTLITQASSYRPDPEDLKIELPAGLRPILSVEETHGAHGNTGNFASGFRLASYDPATRVSAPATTEEILQLRKLPIISTVNDFFEIEAAGEYPLVHLASSGQHVAKPVFIRFLTLFPDFTVDLIHKINSLGNGDPQYRQFEAELFVAHELMRHMVDAVDVGVESGDYLWT